MVGEIGHEELEAALAAARDGDEGVRVVDVRPPSAYRQGHLPGSENVPMNRLVEDVEAFDGADRVVTVCPHGQASLRAARLITSYEGFDGRAESFEPGLTAWDGPVEAGETDETRPDQPDESAPPF